MKTRKLGELADVIRCQLPRRRVEERKDGDLLCLETTLADFNSITGFVVAGSNIIHMQLNPQSKQNKYLIQRGDILFSFRGTEATIGKFGLYVGNENQMPCICGQSICIIRPQPIDTIWIYYYLRNEKTRNLLTSKSYGIRLLTINLTDLRNFVLEIPEQKNIEAIHKKHDRIALDSQRMRELEFSLHEELLDIEELIAGNKISW
jgi:restriction endonuclease S subunit